MTGDRVNRFRRHLEQRLDQGFVWCTRLLGRRSPPPPFDDDPRFAIVVVNASTTHFLKLLLTTLADQERLDIVERVIIVDNRSRDGGRSFVRALTGRVERVHLAENRVFCNHARGMRRGLRLLRRVERKVPERRRANLLLFVDSDVVFRNPETLLDVAAVIVAHEGALAGELRRLHRYPDAHASFFAVRRDIYDRPEIWPWVNHGSPAYWMQRSIWEAGLTVVDFSANHGGWILHRGRTGVEAARRFTPRRAHGTVQGQFPHFMGVPDGPAVWAAIEARHAPLLDPADEPALLAHLALRLARLGRHPEGTEVGPAAP